MPQASSNGRPRIAVLAPRICVLGHEPCGGSEVMLWEDVRLLQDAGMSVKVYGSAAKETAPVTTIPLRTNMPLITSLEYCAAFVRREKNSILMACNEPSVAGFAPDRTVVRFEWDTPLPRYWRLPGWLPRFQRARYLFVSESDREEFLRNHSLIPGESTNVIANCVDSELFKPASRPAGSALRVGFAGQWVPRKGISELLQAWPQVKAQVPAAQLELAGGPAMWKTARPVTGAEHSAALVKSMEDAGLLHTVGALPRARMRDFWNSLDIAVVPSLYEPFGLVALEAMACGIPVVASAIGGLKEIVEEGVSGLLVPPGDSPALANGLVSLLTNEHLRLRLAEGARRRAEEFSQARRSAELVALFQPRN
jgi:glycosyltransferase involved in cell wall biosynthesis